MSEALLVPHPQDPALIYAEFRAAPDQLRARLGIKFIFPHEDMLGWADEAPVIIRSSFTSRAGVAIAQQPQLEAPPLLLLQNDLHRNQ